MFIDTHCHISSCDYDDISFLVEEIKKSGVGCVIANGTDLATSKEVLKLVKKYDIVYGAIGFHPTELENLDEKDLLWLEEHITDDKIVAMGEIGLDYHYDNTDRDRQKYFFKRQLNIAKKNNKPIIVHSRDAIGETYDILKEYNLKGSIHCFSGSLEMALNFIKLGYMIGVGGVATYKNAKTLVNVIKNIDLKYILLETDAPYLSPEPKRGEKNSSCNIPIIASKIAEIKGISLDLVAKTTEDGAKRLFDIL